MWAARIPNNYSGQFLLPPPPVSGGQLTASCDSQEPNYNLIQFILSGNICMEMTLLENRSCGILVNNKMSANRNEGKRVNMRLQTRRKR